MPFLDTLIFIKQLLPLLHFNLKLYDTIYQEKYMGLPSTNPYGYKNGSPVYFAHQLEGDLLLIQGISDDNVHFKNSKLLVNELIK